MSLASLSHAAAWSASPKGSLYNTFNSAARWLLVLVLCKRLHPTANFALHLSDCLCQPAVLVHCQL